MTTTQPTWGELEQVARVLAGVGSAAQGAREAALLAGLAELFAANVTLLFRARLLSAGGVMPVTAHDHGMNDADRARLDAYVAAKGEDDPTIGPSLVQASARMGEVVAMTRQDLIADEEFYAHPHTKNLRRQLGLDQCLNLTLCLDAERVMNLTVHRPLGAPAFTAHERQLGQVLGTAAYRLIGWPALPRGGVLLAGDGALRDLRDVEPETAFADLAPRLELSADERILAEAIREGLDDAALAERVGGPEGVAAQVAALQVKLHAGDRDELLVRLRT
tara:strand:+ start:265 stop:1095 length:831 start_codon:yes stop_codon:yes gene_type:complete